MSHSVSDEEMVANYVALLERKYKRKYGDGFTTEEASAEVLLRGEIKGVKQMLDLLEENDGDVADSRN